MILQFFRLLKINLVLMRYTFKPSIIGDVSVFLKFMSYLNVLSLGTTDRTRGESIREALESLGPIFVKFGQLLSTRRDLLPEDIILELEKLQDQVPSFPGKQALEIIENELNKPIIEAFTNFDQNPLASASIAQVHTANLHTGEAVIIKVTRPKIEKLIRKDVALLYAVAKVSQRFWKQGRRLRLIELVAEFERTILDELDLMREAANASQLRRNFENSDMLYIPRIYWQYTTEKIMVMERIYGVQISDITTLRAQGINMKKLAEFGVNIFFTQVFRDSFFHADMHPGNLFIDTHNPDQPRYIGVDFGIMGTLNPVDQQYLAENILAFFTRNYRQIAILHVESGWVPADTPIDQFESAIRTVSEPVFERPLKDISFGQLLLKLFQTAKRFNMEVQPQLMLLQKTLFSIEALGRRLYPELNLWETAKPFMIDWMRERKGVMRLLKYTKDNWRETAEKILQTPERLFEVLDEIHEQQHIQKSKKHFTVHQPTHKSNKRSVLFGAGWGLIIATAVGLFLQHETMLNQTPWHWLTLGSGALLVLLGFATAKK